MRPRLARALAPLALVAACSSDEPRREVLYPQQDCTTYLLAQPPPGTRAVGVLGSWNQWAQPATPLEPHPTRAGWWYAALTLPPGDHGYLLQSDGVSALDDRNPLTTFRGSDEVSLLTASDCRAPALVVEQAQADDGGQFSVRGRFVAASGGPAIDALAAEVAGTAASATADPATGAFTVTGSGLGRGRHTIRLRARARDGREAAASAAVFVQPRAADWHEGLVYQVVLDRYRGDGGVTLAPPTTLTSRAGGTLGGLRAEIEQGTFEPLGVTALWLSPVYLNPTEARMGRDGHPAEGYHGYWPVASRQVDPRLGGEQALRDVVAAAHARGLRVLLDVVPNHVYESNPVFTANRGQGWFNEQDACVCGFDTCDWGKHILSCWFAPYLPDVRWQSAASTRQQIDDVQWWVDTFEVDGVRIDAVPMMPRTATRQIARALRSAAAGGERPFVLGEVFTGPGDGGVEQIRYFLGPDTLDSAFDFPLMWALRDAVATDRAGFDEVERILRVADEALAGSGTVQARILGNHDVSRFLSVAAGDDGGDPWTAAPPRPSDPATFARHRLGLVLLMTLPGMPVLYYGDELGLAGATDPDCRRVMPALDGLPAEEAETLRVARALGSLRTCSPALRRGSRTPLQVSRDALGFVREADGEQVVVLLAKGLGPTTFTLPPGIFRDALAPGGGEVSGVVQVETGTARVLVSASSACR